MSQDNWVKGHIPEGVVNEKDGWQSMDSCPSIGRIEVLHLNKDGTINKIDVHRLVGARPKSGDKWRHITKAVEEAIDRQNKLVRKKGFRA